MKYSIITILIILLKSSGLLASYESKDIINEVHNFLSIKKNNLVYKINDKLKLPSCFGNIQIKQKYKSLKTLEIICLGEKPWKYNLRTNISEKYTKKKNQDKSKKKKIRVLVSIGNLKKDTILEKNDIKVRYLNHVGSSNTFSEIANLLKKKHRFIWKNVYFPYTES